ncbi:hypothetical protein O3P69_014835 [Scylla paramamosain]|uniref:Pro-resilin n=1 Tax=Scylla paramamosain TaxID=85552 RepID=A0AAW0TY26_SCYPA
MHSTTSQHTSSIPSPSGPNTTTTNFLTATPTTTPQRTNNTTTNVPMPHTHTAPNAPHTLPPTANTTHGNTATHANNASQRILPTTVSPLLHQLVLLPCPRGSRPSPTRLPYRPLPPLLPPIYSARAPSYNAPCAIPTMHLSQCWNVKDDYSSNDNGHQETRDGYDTQGSYYVQLPDGRLQEVTYTVNGDSGFVAQVNYQGEAQYPTQQGYGSAPSYQAPAPSYRQPRPSYA